jgi:hypothetical protein
MGWRNNIKIGGKRKKNKKNIWSEKFLPFVNPEGRILGMD